MDMPAPRVGFIQQPQWFVCHFCYTQAFDVRPVHGDGPCPMKQREHDAYVESLEAQRDSYLRSGMANLDASAMMGDAQKMVRKMMGMPEEEEE